MENVPASSASQGRLLILLAAILWSTSGAFTKVLTRPTIFNLNDPVIEARQIACVRALSATAVLLLFLRRGSLTFRPLMLLMVLCFAAMNYMFVSAMRGGTAADAILLQYTAPMWAYLGAVWLLGEPSDRRSLHAILIGVVGIGIIVAGGWQDAQLDIISLGLGSGFAYAVVLLCLRILRDASSIWLTTLNHLVAGLVLLPFVLPIHPWPTPAQWVVLFLYGSVQMAVPYALMARGLRTLSPQEAGTITLLEPILNPLWTYLVAEEVPSAWSFVGGVFILGALAWRYWPRRASGSG